MSKREKAPREGGTAPKPRLKKETLRDLSAKNKAKDIRGGSEEFVCTMRNRVR